MATVHPFPTSHGTEIPMPSNVEAEAAFLGAVLINNDNLHAAGVLKPEDFHAAIHGRLFERIKALIDSGQTVTPITLKPHFEADEGLREIGGTAYLARLTADGQGLLNPAELTAQIVELAARRRLIEGAREVEAAAADLGTALENISFPVAPSNSACLPFEWAGDVKPDLETAWLVDDFLPKSGPAVIVGPPGAGKSFLALDLAAHVAQGKDWAGRHVEGGAVLYVVAEGASGIRNRIAALIEAKRLERVAPFAFVPTAIDLRTEDGDTAALMATMRAVAKRMGQEPAMIVIDTLSKTFAGGRENTDEMAGYVANCEKIAAKMNCLVLIIHHSSRQSDDERGHSSLRGGVVTSIKVSGAAVKTALTVKQKDGPEGEVVHFSLETVVLGTNSRGKEVTTCLVHYVDGEGGAVGSAIDKAKNRLTGHDRTAYRVLKALQAQSTYPVPAEIPATAIDRARVQCVIPSGQAAGTLATELRAFVNADPDKIADTAKRTARRALSSLKSKEILGSWGDFVWIN